jgi:hypothetical protein
MVSLTYRLLLATGSLLTVFGAPLDEQKVIAIVDEKVATWPSFAKSYGLPIRAAPYLVCIPPQMVSSYLLKLQLRTRSRFTITYPLASVPSGSKQSSTCNGPIYGWFRKNAPTVALVVVAPNMTRPDRQPTNQMAQQ